MSGEMLRRALAALERCRALPVPAALTPGPHGEAILDRFHRQAFATCADGAQLLRFATENNGLVIYRLIDDPRTNAVIDGYLGWLDANGTPLSGFPPAFAETALASAATVRQVAGRPVSASFLWHLCIHARLRGLVRPACVLEIGGGFGGLARLNALADPTLRQVLVDLPETLVFADVYLRMALPDRKVVFATTEAELQAADCDILLVPSALFHALAGRHFDLAINVASFGEMTEAAALDYQDFLQSCLLVDRLYSINQFGAFMAENGQGRGRRLDGVTRSSLQLDSGWSIRLWDMHGARGFAQIDPLAAPSLEVLLERRLLPAGQRQAQARLCCDKAAALPMGSGEWHGLMWQAALLWPQGEDAAAYETYCRNLGWREFAKTREKPT